MPPDLGNGRDWQRRYGDLEQDTEATEHPRRRGGAAFGNRVDRWDPFALGVHHPIAGPQHSPPGSPDLPVLPLYVARQHDQRLREHLDPGRPDPGMVVLVGGSCTGKTRSAYEAVLSCLPGWRLVRPETGADLVHLLADQMVDSETVLWLNETQAYLDGEHGEEAAAALRKLLTGTLRIAVVGTMWDTDWAALTTRTAVGAPGHPQARELLDQSAVKIAVPASFTGQALTELSQVAHGDPRLAEAFHAALGTGEFAQVLAGGPWLIDFYTHGAGPHTKAVLDAAIDAWLLGHHAPLPAAMLEVAAAGYLNKRERAVSVNWLDDALAQATTKIKGAVAPLTAVRTRRGAGAADGFLVADYLLQHASRNPRPPLQPTEVWEALASHTVRADDHLRIAQGAMKRGYGHQAVLHFRSAAESSSVDDSPVRQRDVPVLSHVGPAWRADSAPAIELFDAHGHLAPLMSHERISFNVYDESAGTPIWSGTSSGDVAQSAQRGLAELLERAGHLDEATELQRQLAEQGNRSAPGKLAELLERTGHIDEAVATWRTLAATDEMDDYPMRALTGLLARAGRIDEAVEVAQQMADSGYSYAIEELAGLLENAGKLNEAIAVWQILTQRDDIYAMRMLAALLEGAGRIEEALAVWKDAAERGETFGIEALAGALERAGRVDEAAAAWQPAAQGGDTYAVRMLAGLLQRAGRIDEAVALWAPAAERGESSAIEALARLHEQAGEIDEAIAAWQHLAASDETSDYPMRALAGLLERAGRTDEAAAVWQRAVEHGDPLAVSGLAGLLERAGRTSEAAAVWQPATQKGDIYAMRALAGLLERAGRTDEAAAVWQRAVEHGDPLAVSGLAGLLERAGRTSEAAAVWQPATQKGDIYAMRALTALLERVGRTHETLAIWEPAARRGDTAAMRMLAKFLSKVGRISMAQWWLRNAVQHGEADSLAELAELLRLVGRADEADRVMTIGLEPDGRTAEPWT